MPATNRHETLHGVKQLKAAYYNMAAFSRPDRAWTFTFRRTRSST